LSRSHLNDPARPDLSRDNPQLKGEKVTEPIWQCKQTGVATAVAGVRHLPCFCLW